MLLDLEHSPQPDDLILQQVFGLTPAETRLAKRLAGGEELFRHCRAFRLKIGTVRMQLKAIFWKTGTRRQAELVALLAHMARLERRVNRRRPRLDRGRQCILVKTMSYAALVRKLGR